MLKKAFIHLLKQYTDDDKLMNKLWIEISATYSKRNRHYHTLQHLEDILVGLTDVKSQIINWNALLFALCYHDIVYNVLKHNNEEKSATIAVKKMKALRVEGESISKCEAIILATKAHQLLFDNDINLFTDADLSVLGASWNDYESYYKNIRREYSIYPDIIYNPGRRKILQHFLNMERIYKTTFFFEKFEENARNNLKREIETLS